jgi:hypothetical protein
MVSMDKVKNAIEQSAKQCFWLGKDFEEPKVEVDMSDCIRMCAADGCIVEKLSESYKLGTIRVHLDETFDCTLFGMKNFLEAMDVQPQELKNGESFYRETMMLDNNGKDGGPSLEIFLDSERMFEKFG